ncbi:MAG: hypothetical protein Q4G22_13155 [Paracoccus sp. (in: a-proteobacteria)]|uniref:ATP-grasp domain-containing protein n=1 Tax=Paracoccus sp. TaxID=267 RepID=UPI0026DEDC4F|nr:hypothetical protein [Paracoccus sp. (in: a-proteobacteria)]MDO5632766.1 hypothetical protein [Paracoccus sp. (in: a-proteobacteria)]
MILIAGGRGDPSMVVLADRLNRRGIDYHDLLLGPQSNVQFHIDIQPNRFSINGKTISPTGFFGRHDVFLYQTDNPEQAQAAALNWYQAVRGWISAQPGIRMFNRHTHLRENNKIENLLTAQELGLAIPPTQVMNDLSGLFGHENLIQKPVAGGEYTALIADTPQGADYPRFVQPRLNRPELRIYRIGDAILGFWLNSPDLDYRRSQTAELTVADVPPDLADRLVRLCDRLNLDFAAADFMADDTGALLFLELNSQPMFAAFDRVAQGRLCDAIIDHLRAG